MIAATAFLALKGTFTISVHLPLEIRIFMVLGALCSGVLLAVSVNKNQESAYLDMLGEAIENHSKISLSIGVVIFSVLLIGLVGKFSYTVPIPWTLRLIAGIFALILGYLTFARKTEKTWEYDPE